MADGSFASKVSATRNDNLVTNPIFVQISDGTDGALVTAAGELNVILGANSGVDIGDVDVTSVIPGVGATNLGKAEDAAHTDGDVGVLTLAVRNDAAGSLVDTTLDYAPLQVNASGELVVTTAAGTAPTAVDDSAFTIGVDSVSPSGFLADETAPDSVDEGDVGLARMTLDRKVLVRIVGATDANRWDVDGSGLGQVDIAAHALTNTNALPISKDNSANSETNPIFVKLTTTVVSGVEVHDFDTAAGVGSDATSNHDYTVTGTNFFLRSVIWSGSGSVKAEIQTGPLATLATVAVGFLTGRQGDTQQLNFDPPVEVPVTGTGTIRVIRTNRQGASTDVYSTIIGNDV